MFGEFSLMAFCSFLFACLVQWELFLKLVTNAMIFHISPIWPLGKLISLCCFRHVWKWPLMVFCCFLYAQLMTFLPHPAVERNSTCTNNPRHSERDVGHASFSPRWRWCSFSYSIEAVAQLCLGGLCGWYEHVWWYLGQSGSGLFFKLTAIQNRACHTPQCQTYWNWYCVGS